MLGGEQDDNSYRVHYRSYRLALVLLLLPPLVLYEHLPALVFGVVLPLLGAHMLIEFASFGFSLRDNRFRWRWRNLLRKKSLGVALQRVVG